jgi:DNA-binding winged helix-turn-helix (wHTH) protein/tetratricopeptide (TPR) repeat protein
VLDVDRRELSRGSETVAVEPQVFDLLVYLVHNRERVVTKDDLIEAVWHGRIVTESTLTSRINAARKAIGDNGVEQRLIRTIPRKGLRFVGEVRKRRWPPRRPPQRKRPATPWSERSQRDPPAIAVLPFTNMSGDPEQEYFSDGISEDIITALSKLRWFFVIARNSSFMYKGKSVDLAAGRRRPRRALRTRRQRAQGRRPRAHHRTAQRRQHQQPPVGRALTIAASPTCSPCRTRSPRRSLPAIEPQLYAAENFRAQRKPPDSMDAWDLVMRALSHYWRVTRQDHVVAQALLEKAIAIDPNYGQALGVLATSYIFTAHMGWMEMTAAVPLAERAALAAARQDSEDPWAHNALGHVYLFARRFDDSLKEFELALRLNPSFALAQGYYGSSLCYCGRWEDADAAANRALRLSPRGPYSPVYLGIAAFAQFLGRKYDTAIQLCRDALRERGDFVGAHRVLTAAAGMTGETDVARAALAECRRAQAEHLARLDRRQHADPH